MTAAMEKPSLHDELEIIGQGFPTVAGVDEVGRGCLAGPVTIGMAIWDMGQEPPEELRDSKAVPAKRREELYQQLALQCTAWAVATASPQEIDEFGIVRALGLAATRALRRMRTHPDAIILDGALDYVTPVIATKPVPRVFPVVKADSSSVSAAAASVLAKVTRDRFMHQLHQRHPQYGWDTNVGYGSKKHLEALYIYGPTKLHRMTFRPLKKPLAGER